VTHRDIKVENILLQNKAFKICDFGSATTRKFEPRDDNERDEMFDDFAKFTTFMYRPPEMIDRLRNYEVSS